MKGYPYSWVKRGSSLQAVKITDNMSNFGAFQTTFISPIQFVLTYEDMHHF